MLGILIAPAYVVLLGGCGFLLSRLLRITSVFAETGMTFVFGTAAFLLLLNGLGYVLPVQTAAITALVLIGCFDVVAILLLRKEQAFFRPASSPADRRGAQLLFLITALAGFAGARYIGSDPWSWQHFPLAATIVAGNFPVHSPIDPESLLRYHYAPALLAAAFRILTGFPLTAGFALQPLIGAGGILFFSAALVRRYRSLQTALIAAVLAFAGSGLVWLKVPELHSLFLGFTGLAPLRPALAGLADLVGTPLTTSPLVFLGHRSTATGFPLFFGLLFVLSLFLDERDRSRKALLGVLLFIFALALTLTMEIAFVTVSIAAVASVALLLPFRSTRSCGTGLLAFGACVLVPALLVALVHGGVLSGLLDGGQGAFVFRPSLTVMFDTYGNTAFLFGWRFLRDFGFPLFLFPFACVFAWRRRSAEPIWTVIALAAFIHLLLPFLFDYELIRGEMHRFFYGATSLMAMLAGITVADTCFGTASRLRRGVGILLVVSMIASGALYLVLRLAIPTMRFEKSPVFATMPPISLEQYALYEWVKTHTTEADYFYIRNLTVDFESITDEATVQMRDRILFTTYTGRFTVGPIIYWEYRPDWLAVVKTAEETCGADAMQSLHVRYLLVETPDRSSWFAKHCSLKDWKAVYGASGDHLPKIYELRPSAATI